MEINSACRRNQFNIKGGASSGFRIKEQLVKRKFWKLLKKAEMPDTPYYLRKFCKSAILQFFAWLSKVCETLKTLQFMKKVQIFHLLLRVTQNHKGYVKLKRQR